MFTPYLQSIHTVFTPPPPLDSQAIVYWGCLGATMALCATRVAAGRLTIGDAVAINGLLIQLHSPLTALGYTYQEIRQVRGGEKAKNKRRGWGVTLTKRTQVGKQE
eukprot:scaffold14457_cov98-Isochrysis_galbana.AAC.1